MAYTGRFTIFQLSLKRADVLSLLSKMSSLRRICPDCEKSVDATHYARHIKSHVAKFQCEHCPSLSFKRLDNYIRHLKVHSSFTDDNEASSTSATVGIQPFVIKEEQL